eukprot:1150349-Pelagomonas_calceolata.AAC.1
MAPPLLHYVALIFLAITSFWLKQCRLTIVAVHHGWFAHADMTRMSSSLVAESKQYVKGAKNLRVQVDTFHFWAPLRAQPTEALGPQNTFVNAGTEGGHHCV